MFEFNNQRYYLLQDGEYYTLLEHLIDGFAPLVILLCILCAFWIDRLTSARVTASITRLAEVVQRKQNPSPFRMQVTKSACWRAHLRSTAMNWSSFCIVSDAL
ncbi:MAG: hypothetical protein ACMZI0_14325 [Symbiopectobacterium sp.]|uniref:hypothetical protein n=1 Tax=Symbiopectobacterium sp. TaxID=2952789 RepID=UPI0039EB9001